MRARRWRSWRLAALAAWSGLVLWLAIGSASVAACSPPPDPTIEALGPQQIVLLGRTGDPVPGGRAFHVERWFNGAGPAVVTIAFKEGEPVGDCSYRVDAGIPLIIAPVMEPDGRLSADLGTLQASPVSPQGVAFLEEANRLFGPGVAPATGEPLPAEPSGDDWSGLLLVGLVGLAAAAWVVARLALDRRRTAEEVAELAAVQADRDRHRTSAIEMADRTNLHE
jgi:hypothetical protein